MPSMRIHPAVRAACVVAAIPLIVLPLKGCSSSRGSPGTGSLETRAPRADAADAQGVWVASANASFAHLGEETVYTVVYASDDDLLAIDQPLYDPARPGRVIGKATWLIPVSMYAALGTPIEFGADDPKAFVLESLEDAPDRVIPATGRVTVHSRERDVVEATISLASLAPPPTAGGPRPSRLVLGARMALEKREIDVPQPDPPGRR